MTLQQKLLSWFDKNKRPLPWRKDYIPYEVWVSEIMLQQTQMETMLPYFKRWMANFPTLQSLAGAPEQKVLKLWQGLGYYSRARNLHRNAKLIAERFGGVFPSDYETILSLKGIGRYTAGAIASIAFNQKKPIVDGNVFRVLSRLYGIRKPIDVEKNKESFWKLEESLIPERNARDFNQALMELGALVCKAQDPACALCPLSKNCLAFRRDNPENFPVRARKKKIVKVEAAALVFEKNGKFLIRLRPVGEIMGGLWEFPEWKLVRNGVSSADNVLKKTRTAVEREFGLPLNGCDFLGTIKRNYTHHVETMYVFRAALGSSSKLKSAQNDWPSVWTTKKSFKEFPFSSAHAKITRLLS